MTPEQALIFAAEGNPACMQGFFQAVVSAYTDEPKLTNVFRTGEGLAWGDHSECLFCGTERFFRPMYAANLVDSWLPELDGVCEKLEAGAKGADIGCGHGSSTIIMAQAFPNSTFHGFDFTNRRLSMRVSGRVLPALHAIPSSRLLRPKSIPAKTTTSWLSLTPYMIWVIR